MQKQPIKVALADDHVLLRHALSTLIDNSGTCKVILQASNGAELSEKLSKDNLPDVVILDMNMPEMDGRETAIWLQANYPSIRVLMLTMYDSELTLIRLLQAGVKGFMKKDIHPTELLHAIQAVMDNGYYYSAHTSSKLAGLFRESINKLAPLQKIMLDEQEVKFLRLVCTEMTYKEIAREMGMNPRSIDGIRDMLFNRLDAKSRIGLAMYAIRHGLVTF
jgi:two-component system, NarL family, invasion response regulator UvrY